MRCGIISSCQSAATSEIVKRSWACVHRGAALCQVPDLYLLPLRAFIDGTVLSLVESTGDLGVSVSSDLSPSVHISDIVAKANKRSAAIYRAFTWQNVDLLVRAYVVCVRPFVEHDCGFNCLTCTEHLKRSNLPNLLRRLHTDLIYCYKVLFGHVDLRVADFFEWVPYTDTRGHKYSYLRKTLLCVLCLLSSVKMS